ncbi:MAG: septum formation initiator family protein [Desulfomonile sp.]|nr:septum formation initiator family protein [Desulfomonile sp.]
MARIKQVTSIVRSYASELFGFALRNPRTGRAGALLALGLVALLLSGGLFYVWTRMQLVEIGYEIADKEKVNNALKNRKRELLVEISSLQNPADLEKQARERAGLVFPDMGKVVHVP